MFHQSMSRSQRAKGSKAKKILQVAILLAVVIWLLYQTKHSYDRKEYVGTDNNKLSKGDTDIYFGRKVNTGSQNGFTIDPHRRNSDETTETKKTGGDQADAFDWHTEEKAEEEALKKENEESQADITNGSEEETHQEQQGNVDDNAGSHIMGEVNGEGTEEVLHLPSQTESENENINGVGDSVEENGLPKDDVFVQTFTTDGANSGNAGAKTTDEGTFSSSTDQTEIGEIAARGSEPGETGGKHIDNAVPVTEAFSNSSVSADQSNIEMSTDKEIHKEETVESQGDIGSDTEITRNNTVEEAATNPRSDDEVVSSSLPNEQNNAVSSDVETFERVKVGSQSDNTPKDETTEHHHLEAATTDKSSESENVNLPNSTGENNVVMPDNEGAPKREEIESRVDGVSEAEIAGNSSMQSEGENANLPNSTEENNVVMPDSNGAPKRGEGESQVDSVSEGQITGKSSIEAAISDTSSEGDNANLPNSTEENNVVMSDNNGAPKREEESQVDHVSKGEITGNSSSEEAKTDTRSDNELATLSLADEQNSAEKAANNEASRREAIESQGANASDAEVTTNNAIEEEKDPKSSVEVANSSLANEDEHIELSANIEDAKVEAVESIGDGASDAESSGKNSLEEAKSETSDDEVANSSQNNDQINSEIPTNETPNGQAVESQGDGAFEVESTGNNALKDTKTEPKSNDVTSSESGNSIELSVGNGTADIGQEGSTGSESSSSEEELRDLKKSAEL